MSHTMRRRRARGFTLAEIMTVAAIISVLSTLAAPELKGFLMRSKRAEAVLALETMRTAQAAHLADRDQYAGGLEALAFAVEGGRRLSSTTYQGQRYSYTLSQPWGA